MHVLSIIYDIYLDNRSTYYVVRLPIQCSGILYKEMDFCAATDAYALCGLVQRLDDKLALLVCESMA